MSVVLDQEINVETISNQSGDTLLLVDDTDSSDEVPVSYASRVLSSSSRDCEQGSSLDNQQRYIGRDRSVTPFHPWTAYFSADHFSDSKEVFDTLKKYNFLPKSIQCLQHRAPRVMLITLASAELKERFLRQSFIEFRDGLSVVNDDDCPLTYLKVYDAR